MPNSHTDHTQYSKQEIIAHCKKWLDGHRNDDMPTLLSDYIAATVETDILTYPITTQEWVSKDSEPELWDIVIAAGSVNRNHSDPQTWQQLTNAIEIAIKKYNDT